MPRKDEMNHDSYLSYSHEVSSWLHSGRKQLISKIMNWHLEPSRKPYEILEVGAGVGQNIEALKSFGEVDVIEIDPVGLSSLKAIKEIRSVFDQGITSAPVGQYDVIVACDVIEHLKDDFGAVKWIFDHLRVGGLFIATVPAFQWLFNDHDRALGHFRRYEQQSFDRLLPQNCVKLSGGYFNSYLFPVAVISRIAYQTRRSIRGISVMEKQKVPTNRFIEPVLRWVFHRDIATLNPNSSRLAGLSYFACARKL